MPDRETPREPSAVWAWVTVAWVVWGAINTARLHETVPGISWRNAVWYGLPDALIWAALTPLIVLATRGIAASGRTYLQSLAIHLPAAAGVALVHSAADTSIAALRNLAAGAWHEPWAIFVTIVSHTAHVNVLVYFLISVSAYYLHTTRSLARRQRRTAELRAELAAAELASLQSQLRPHFLFNALHTISGLVESDPQRAQRAIRQLGELLRMSLRGADRQTIPLADEIAFVEAYLGVEQARFGDRLRVEMAIDERLGEDAVPALVLQPLVENAVRHGVSKNPEGGRLRVSAAAVNGRLRLEVTDDGPGMPAGVANAVAFANDGVPDDGVSGEAVSRDAVPGDDGPGDDGSGVGLTNTRARLAALYGADHLFRITPLEPHGVRVTIELPRDRPEAPTE